MDFDPRAVIDQGIVAIGGLADVKTLLSAYRNGIFPWPHPGFPIIWHSPEQRGIIDFNKLHIPRSLAKFRRQNSHLQVRMNTVFSEVIRACQLQPRPGQDGTWITDELIRGYEKLFIEGYILCLEIWDQDQLIAGIYGVLTEKYFSGESMFFRRPNTSKLALWLLIEELQKRGHQWMDIQMVTDVSGQLGGEYISREQFLSRIGC